MQNPELDPAPHSTNPPKVSSANMDNQMWVMWGFLIGGMVLVTFANGLGASIATNEHNYVNSETAVAATTSIRLLGAMCFFVGLVDRVLLQVALWRQEARAVR